MPLRAEQLEPRQVLAAIAAIDPLPAAGDWLAGTADTASANGPVGGTGLFTVEQQLAGDDRAGALGDLDGDGDLDAFIARSDTQTRGKPNAVWINDATGQFADSGQALAGPDGASSSFAVALGDLDGDGDLDAFVGNSQANRVWINDGSGTFQDSGQSLGDADTQAVALGDVDNDGDLDAFVGNASDGTANRLWLNDGSGTFQDSGQILGNSETRAVALGDLDGDGDLDAFAGNASRQPNKIWLNDGAGQFIDSGQEIGVGTTHDVSLGDVDGDGDLDVLAGNDAQTQTKVWLNDGSGTLDRGYRFGKVRGRAVALGDLDGDGDLDALIGVVGPVQVWLNDGQGEYTKTPQVPFHTRTAFLNLGDLDGDGDLDVLVGTKGSKRFSTSIWKNRNHPLAADISFTDITDRLAFDDPGQYAGAAWFDFNNDQYQDLYVNGATAAGNRLYQNNGDGSFTDVTAGSGLETTVGHAGVVAGDFDNDGQVDLLLSGRSQELHTTAASDLEIYRNLGDGTFQDITAASGLIAPLTPDSVSLTDIDDDSYLDVFITAGGSFDTGIQYASGLYHNNGDLTFTNITSSAGIHADLGACATGFSDYDNDGDQDLFVANCNDLQFDLTPVQLFRNNGDLTFDDVTDEAGLAGYGGFWMGVSFADYDQDGDIDLFATNAGVINLSTPHALFENNGDGTFTNVAQRAGLANWEFGWGAALADFNNDSSPDLFFAGTCNGFHFLGPGLGNPGRLFINDPESVFPDPQFVEFSGKLGIDISSANTSGVAHADLDNNGFEDIFVMTQRSSGVGSSPPKLLLNEGNGNHWLGVELEGVQSNRDAVGARVTLHAGDKTQVQEVHAGTSFLSMDSQSLRFGLGARERAGVVEVRWPSAVDELFTRPAGVDQIVTLREGDGVPRTAGDMDLDGDADADDAGVFARALADPASYAAAYGAPSKLNGDMDGDGDHDFDDISLFAAKLGAAQSEARAHGMSKRA